MINPFSSDSFNKLKQPVTLLPKKYSLAIILVSGFVAGVLAQTWLPTFEAKAKLSVGTDVKTQQERMVSRPVVLQTLYALQPRRSEVKKVTAKLLEHGFSSEQIKNSDVLLVKFRNPDAKAAAVILNTWCLTFMAHDQFAQQQDQIKEREYLESQLKQKQDLIQAAETEKRNIRRAKPSDKVTALRLTKKIEMLSQAYDKLLGQYRQVLIDQTEPPSKVMFIESALTPGAPLYPYAPLVFLGVFVVLAGGGIATLWWLKKPNIQLQPQPKPKPMPQPIPEAPAEAAPNFLFPDRGPLEPFAQEEAPAFTPPTPEEEIPQWAPLSQASPQIAPTEIQIAVEAKGREKLLENPVFKKRSACIAVTALHLRKMEMTWILSLIQPMVEANKKVVLVSLSDSQAMSKFLQIPFPHLGLLDYMRGNPLPTVLQATRIKNLSWIPADGALPIVAHEESLAFMTRRLKMYFDVIIYTHTYWEEEVPAEKFQNFVEGWVVLEMQGQPAHEVKDYLDDLQQPVLAQIPL